MDTGYLAIFGKFMGTGLVLILFLAALIYLFFTEKRKTVRIIFLYFPILVLLVYFNPIFYRIFSNAVGGEIYFRILWLLPVTPVLAYTGITIYGKTEEKKKIPLLAGLLILFAFCGRLVYSNPLFSRAENIYHVPDYVAEICDAIEVEGREVMAVFPQEFLLYVRQYSAVVCMPYGRDAITYLDDPFFEVMESDVIDAEQLAFYAQQAGCHYIVLREDAVLEGNLPDYELFASIDEYIIYKSTTLYMGL